MESSADTDVCEPSSQRTVLCLVSWALSSKLSSQRLEFLTTLIIVGFLLVSAMFSTVCCIIFLWRRKQSVAKKTSQNVIVKHKSNGTHSKTPAIRSQDVVSFVLPSQGSNSTGEHQSKFALVESQASSSTPGNNSAAASRCNNNWLMPSNFKIELYSPGHETNENVHLSRAKIGVSLYYNSSRQVLVLKILGALNLPSRSKNIPPDPYVKILILAGRQMKCTTKIIRSNCNPLFNQSFELDVSGLNLNTSEMLLMVRDRPEQSCYERAMTRSVTLGRATISLSELRELNNRRLVRWCLLEDEASIGSPQLDITNASKFTKGEMLISLRYESELGQMILELLQMRSLSFNNQDKEKVTIKVLLYERGYLMASRRTNGIRRDEATAALREKFVFALQSIHEASCQLVLVTKSTIGLKKTLGRITLGHRHFFSAWANSSDLSKGIDHWHDMAHRPGVAIERWHPFV